MSIKEKLENELKDAMRERNELRKTTLRMALSAVKLKEVEKEHIDKVSMNAFTWLFIL